MKRAVRLSLAPALALVVLWLVALVACYRTVPAGNTDLTHFDTILVLGTPSRLDGSIAPEQGARVREGVQEFRAGVAPHLIMSGGAAHNRFAEAHTMAEYAVSLGVPRDAVLEEGQAQNTIQNIFYSRALMRRHGWQSAEIVSSPSHLPRAALILEHYSFPWRTHASGWPPEYSAVTICLHFWVEAGYCMRLRLFGFPRSPFLPAS